MNEETNNEEVTVVPIDVEEGDNDVEVEKQEKSKVKKVPKTKSKSDRRCVVTSNMAHVFELPDDAINVRSLTRVARGNSLIIINVIDEDWVEVRVPRINGSITGFIKTSKLRME